MPLTAKQYEIDSSIRRDALVSALQPVATALIRADRSLGVLVRAAKLAYLLAAVTEIRDRSDRLSVSRLSVITGMTRKDISALLKTKLPGGVLSSAKQMEHRALRVLRGWKHDPLYLTAGRPRDLPVRGEGRSLATLVRSYGGDVPTVSVLRELERMKAVRRTSNGTLRLRTRIPSAGSVSSGRFEEFTKALCDFSHTAAQLVSDDEAQQTYIGFKEVPTADERQIARFKDTFRRRAATLLESVEMWGDSPPYSRRKQRAQRALKTSRRVGVGVYLVDISR